MPIGRHIKAKAPESSRHYRQSRFRAPSSVKHHVSNNHDNNDNASIISSSSLSTVQHYFGSSKSKRESSSNSKQSATRPVITSSRKRYSKTQSASSSSSSRNKNRTSLKRIGSPMLCIKIGLMTVLGFVVYIFSHTNIQSSLKTEYSENFDSITQQKQNIPKWEISAKSQKDTALYLGIKENHETNLHQSNDLNLKKIETFESNQMMEISQNYQKPSALNVDAIDKKSEVTTNINDHEPTNNSNIVIKSDAKIAYVLPVYECPKYKARDHTSLHEEERYEKLEDTAFLDAAAVLKYSIHRNSMHNPSLNPPSKYSYQMVAFVHESVQDCYDQDGYSRVDALRILGYDVQIMKDPVHVQSEMKNTFLKKAIGASLETGERDLIRIHAFDMVNYDIVVLLDLRTLVTNPLDPLFDMLTYSLKKGKPSIDMGQSFDFLRDQIEFAHTTSRPTLSTINNLSVLFTRDYSSVSPENRKVGIHPGLFILKPSKSIYNDFVRILKQGDYRKDSGWGGTGIGDFWGGMTTRGIFSYYFDQLNPHLGLELNRCYYNNMGSAPFIRVEGEKVCRNMHETYPNCEDCRSRTMEVIKAINLSACRDPWSCYHHAEDIDTLRLCRDMHSFWFKARRELEGAWAQHGGGGEFGYVPSNLAQGKDRVRPLHFLGYCTGKGKEKYIRMVPPGIDEKKEGPALNPNDVMNQYGQGANNNVYSIRKPKKHFDPEAVVFQFADGHPKQGKIG